MTLMVREDSINYPATVVKLPVKQKIQGFDNLVSVSIFGNDVLIGKDEDESILYLFFPSGTQLSGDFCFNNNLFKDSQLNLDKEKKGYFEPHGRVKALKFKGVISTGFLAPLSALDYIDKIAKGKLKEGNEFTDLGDFNICKKYVSPSNQKTQGAPGKPKSKVGKDIEDLLVPNQFRFHEETNHLAKNLHLFQEGDIIAITDKWHGSSAIFSRVYVKKPLSFYERFINFIGGGVPDKEIGYIYSSGKPKSRIPKKVLNKDGEDIYTSKTGSYYSSDIWKRASRVLKDKIEDGISLYGELVGFTEEGSYIQKSYDYKCISSQYRFPIYRITYTKPNGEVIEFSWQQIKDYCEKYGLERVNEFFFGRVKDFIEDFHDGIGDSVGELLYKSIINNGFNLEQDCKECNNKVPAEGITVRIDGKNKFHTYKLKSKKFTLKEEKDLEEGLIDIEQT